MSKRKDPPVTYIGKSEIRSIYEPGDKPKEHVNYSRAFNIDNFPSLKALFEKWRKEYEG